MSKNNKHTIFPSWSPLFKEPPDGDMNEYREYIFQHIKFSKILRSLKLRPEECSTNRYSHRMICPFKFHKNGRERTGSFRFNDDKNIFTCFGCNESGDILKFLSLYCGGCEQFHLKKLAAYAGLLDRTDEWIVNNNIEEDNVVANKDVMQQILFNSGLLIRNYLHELKNNKIYIDECEWADQMLLKIDKYFEGLEQDNTTDAEKIFNNLHNSIVKRKAKLGL